MTLSTEPGPGPGIRIFPIPAFQDNYIWVLERAGRAVVVDPGDAAPVLRALDQGKLGLDAILITHHHADHVGGVAALAAAHGARVFGPAKSPFAHIDVRLHEGDGVSVLGQDFCVLEVPGHTLDHIAYWCSALGALFCGDTLFACGCGRLFEGSAAQMFASLGKIAQLPEDTKVYCAHEYTSANIRFALAVEPANQDLVRRRDACAAMRQRGQPTVPSTIGLERATNPFLRCAQATIQAAAGRRKPGAGRDEREAFAALRSWKDVF
jgi:hydroxyacylglutathione hydrolase